MFPILALLFIVVPILELTILIELGQRIDVLPTLAIIFTTGIVGAWLARNQGRRAMSAIQTRLQRGELPGDDLIDGLLILIAGVVLITPGLLTDVTGMLLLLPPVRALVRGRLKGWFKKRVSAGVSQVGAGMGGPVWFSSGFGGRGPGVDDDIIDVNPEPEAPGSEDADQDPVRMITRS